MAPGCAGGDPGLDGATRAFERLHPEYVVRRSEVIKTMETTKVVAIDFSAPTNRKNRGRAEVLVRKGERGAWEIVEEKVDMR